MSLARTGGTRPPGTTSDRCEIRGIGPIADPFYTYCANFHTGSRVPDGPVFAADRDHDRIPWHGEEAVRVDWLADGESRLVVHDDGHELAFVDREAYLAWWRECHPGETGEYPWALHEASLHPRDRATGHDGRGGLLRRLFRRRD